MDLFVQNFKALVQSQDLRILHFIARFTLLECLFISSIFAYI